MGRLVRMCKLLSLVEWYTSVLLCRYGVKTVLAADEFRCMVTMLAGTRRSYTLISGYAPPFAITTCVSFTLFNFINSASHPIILSQYTIDVELVL